MCKKDYNIGLAILRTIMCFMVVLCHCWDAPNVQGVMKIISLTRGYAVSVFMLMSFILVQQTLVEHKKSKLIARFERLLIPQFGWAIIYWGVYSFIDMIFDTQLEHGIKDLIWQMFLGHSPQLNATMWYQVDLIYLTLLFLAVILIFQKNYETVLMILGFLALAAQYSGINLIFDNLRFELKYPLGRFAEMLPIAVGGFVISSHKILEKLKSHTWIVIISSIAIIGVEELHGLLPSAPGYGYSGIRMIAVAASFVALFYVIPFDRLNDRMKKLLQTITKYTMGIYCMHRLVSTLLSIAIIHWDIAVSVNSFNMCILIYILCFVLSWIGSMLLGKTKLNALFN